MTSFFGLAPLRLAVAATAFAALVAIAMPSAGAAPATDASPATDARGFVDSTARCSAPTTAAAFGSTATSRVAICKSPGGQYEYRGVRVSDGAKLILPATNSGSGAFVAENAGIRYTLTSSALTISAGSRVIREESTVYYHGSTPSSTAPTAAIPSAKPDTPTPTAPLAPPLPAEVGHA